MQDAQIDGIRSRVAKAFDEQTQEDTILRGTVPDDMVDAARDLVVQIRGMGRDFEQAAILELDELVHESMEEAEGDYEERSQAASAINNSGLEEQVASVFLGFGVDEGAQRIREAAGLPRASPAP